VSAPVDRVRQLVAAVADSVTATPEQVRGLSEAEIAEVERDSRRTSAMPTAASWSCSAAAPGTSLQGNRRAVYRNLRIREQMTMNASPFLLHRGQFHHTVAGLASAALSTGVFGLRGTPGDPSIRTNCAKFLAAFRSRSMTSPQAWQLYTRTPSGSTSLTAPQVEQRLEEGKNRGATTNLEPYHSHL